MIPSTKLLTLLSIWDGFYTDKYDSVAACVAVGDLRWLINVGKKTVELTERLLKQYLDESN